ncbi:MAG: 4-diphosphocytidyl-2C-methyl-D-erythritol synthase [Panacagrimonas sp.]|nr:4-diphosphocytidyl-2C-methyl-D-erythritol synthase [Panacagrimonas sp.]
MSVAIVLLAAGTSSRFGSLKQVEVLDDGRSLVRRAADTALATGLPLWVVTGAQDDRVRAELAGLSLRVVHNLDWASGMGGSLSCGVRAAEPNAEALIVMLADQPLVTVDDLYALLREHAPHPGSIVAAEYDSVIGPPCLFPARDFPDLIALEGDRGARAVLRQQAQRVRRVAMPNAALDVDTAEDLARAAALLGGPSA